MNFVITKDEYLNAKKAWAQPRYHHSATDHIIYNALRGFDLRRGFSPITDQQKLSNGAFEWQSYDAAKSNARWEIRISPRYTSETADRAIAREKENAERFKNLSIKFGVEFTLELAGMLSEILA